MIFIGLSVYAVYVCLEQQERHNIIHASVSVSSSTRPHHHFLIGYFCIWMPNNFNLHVCSYYFDICNICLDFIINANFQQGTYSSLDSSKSREL